MTNESLMMKISTLAKVGSMNASALNLPSAFAFAEVLKVQAVAKSEV